MDKLILILSFFFGYYADAAFSDSVRVNNFPATQAVTQSGAWSVGLTGTLPAFASTPTVNLGTIAGVATESTLNSIDGKTPALGQGLMAASVPVAIASNQTAIPVTGTFFQATQPVSIASSVAVTGPLTDAQLRATAVPISGTVTANTGLSQPLTDTQLRASAVPVSLASTTITNFPATQPISAASLPLPTGAAQDRTTAAAPSSTRLSDGTDFLASFDMDNAAGVSKALSVTIRGVSNGTPVELGTAANAFRIDPTGTTTQPISATSLPLPTGASTLAEQISQTNLLGDISSLVGGVFNSTLTTLTSGQASALQLDNKGRILRGVDNGRISYAAATASSGFTAAATANQDVWRISGSETKTIYIKKIRITATATAVQGNRISLIKRSAANTGGTAVNNTLVPYDSTDVAATASVVHYTAAPTSGAAVGQVRTASYLIPTATGLYNSEMIFEFVENEGNPLVLTGTAEGLGIVFGVAPGGGNLISISVEWDEE